MTTNHVGELAVVLYSTTPSSSFISGIQTNQNGLVYPQVPASGNHWKIEIEIIGRWELCGIVSLLDVMESFMLILLSNGGLSSQ